MSKGKPNHPFMQDLIKSFNQFSEKIPTKRKQRLPSLRDVDPVIKEALTSTARVGKILDPKDINLNQDPSADKLIQLKRPRRLNSTATKETPMLSAEILNTVVKNQKGGGGKKKTPKKELVKNNGEFTL